jgi:hypothetical protein
MINRTFRSSRFLAPMLALGVAACSGAPGDSSSISAPSAPRLVRTTAAVGDPGDHLPNQGELEICKTGAAGSFDVTPLGGSPTTYNLADGECRVIAVHVLVSGLDTVRLTVTENASATATFTSVTKTTVHNEFLAPASTTPDEFDAPVVSTSSSTVQIKLNEYIGSLLEYVNTPITTGGCTYTKGWYRNNGSNTIIASADGLTKSQQQQVFNATPGQPGLVTWTGGNNTLNLYQQLLAAINNLGGNETAGPAAVDAAIAAAKAGTNVTTNSGGVQIALVAGTNSSALIATLSSFNEGSLGGFPHCGDEVVAQ